MTTPIPTPELPIRCKNCGGEIRDSGTVWVHVKYGVAEGKRSVSEDQDCERLWGRTVTPSLIAEPELTTRFPVPESQAERIATLERLVEQFHARSIEVFNGEGLRCLICRVEVPAGTGEIGQRHDSRCVNREAEAALRKEPSRG